MRRAALKDKQFTPQKQKSKWGAAASLLILDNRPWSKTVRTHQDQRREAVERLWRET